MGSRAGLALGVCFTWMDRCGLTLLEVDDMRCLGEIEGRKNTEVFVAYLLTQQISAQIECTDSTQDRWEIWIRDEDKLSSAKTFLNEFRQSPGDPRYTTAVAEASRLLSENEKRRQLAAKNLRRMEMRPGRGMGGVGRGGPLPPLTLTLLILCIVISIASGFGNPGRNNQWAISINEQLSFVATADYEATEGDPAASLKKGEIWRAVTPIFLHLDLLHLAMNMLFLVSFGRMVERWLGTPSFAMFVLLLSIGPNLLQGLAPDWMWGFPFFGGISGVLYGLFGYVWLRSTFDPTLGVSIPIPIAFVMVGIIVLGMLGIFPALRFAHLAHLGGLLIGSAMGYATARR